MRSRPGARCGMMRTGAGDQFSGAFDAALADVEKFGSLSSGSSFANWRSLAIGTNAIS
jgi:hypothetical protein